MTLREWLGSGPYTLALSSGFFGFYAHTGFLSVLEAEGLAPLRIAGSSAGALVGGLWAAGLDTGAIEGELRGLHRRDFWDPRPGAGLLEGRLFRSKLEGVLPARSFEQCRTPLAVSVFDVGRGRTRVLERGPLAPALHASCAVPLLFHPVRHDGAWLVDGGVADRPGLASTAGAPRVLLHHLTSRSPWRRASSPALAIPRRRELVVVAIDGLDRLGPFRLERGPRVIERARAAARTALDAAVVEGLVRV